MHLNTRFVAEVGIHVVVLIGLMALGLMSSSLAGQVVKESDGIHIVNGDAAQNSARTLKLDEVWRVGGEDDSDVVFGQIARVLGDDDGRTYIFDAQQCQVFVYEADGQPSGTLFAAGQGPGELGMPGDVFLMSDNQICSVERFNGKIVSVDLQGHPMDSIQVAGEQGRTGVSTAGYGGGHLVLGGTSMRPGDRDMTSTRVEYLATFGPDGSEIRRHHEFVRQIDYQNNFTFDENHDLADFRWTYHVASDGRLYFCPHREAYSIHVVEPDGRLAHVIDRAFEPRRRSDQERKRMDALIERRFRTFPFDLTVNVADTEPTLNWTHHPLQTDDSGNLWVRHSRSGVNQPAGILLTFDVFDPKGHFVEQVQVPCEGDAVYDGVFLMPGNRLIVVKGFVDAMRTIFGGGQGPFEDAPDPRQPEVICYTIEG